jgi:hypothetical protein
LQLAFHFFCILDTLISRHLVITDGQLVELIQFLDKVLQDDQVLHLAHERSQLLFVEVIKHVLGLFGHHLDIRNSLYERAVIIILKTILIFTILHNLRL